MRFYWTPLVSHGILNLKKNAHREGRREGRHEGRQEEFAKGVRSIRKAGLDDAKIASLLERDAADVEAVK